MKHWRTFLATLFALTLAQSALADGSTAPAAHKMYVAADVGTSRSRSFASESEANDTSSGFDVRLGYQFSRYFALELGYVDLGSFDFDYRPNCIPEANCDVTAHTEMHGPIVNVVGIFPLGDHWQLKGRAGFFRLDASSTQTTSDPADVPLHFSEKSSGVSLGAAATYRLNDNIDLEISWMHFEQVDLGLTIGGGVGAFSSGTSSMAAVGVAYRF
jgi:opacity protein-like surface antigen